MPGIFNPFTGMAQSYGGTKMGNPNLFGQYLSTGTWGIPQQALYGHGLDGETPEVKDFLWKRFMSTMQPGGGAARAGYLSRIQPQVYNDAAGYDADTGGAGHLSDYLGSIDVDRMWREADPFSAGRNQAYWRTRTAG